MTFMNREFFLFSAVIAVGIYHGAMLRPIPELRPVMRMKAVKNLETVYSLDQERDWRVWRSGYVDTAEFPVRRELTHRRAGPLGISSDLFLDLETLMYSASGGEYVFLSYLGYSSSAKARIILNGEIAGVHKWRELGNRAEFRKKLDKGVHRLEINYLQSAGSNYLEVFYSPPGTEEFFPVGKNSDNTFFNPPLAGGKD